MIKISFTLLICLLFFCCTCQNTYGQWSWEKGENYIPLYPLYGTQGISNPANKPGGRLYSTSWKDAAGNYWMFGGSGLITNSSGVGNLNDLWKFTASTGEWTWMNGDSYFDALGYYGTAGVSSSYNKPGGRQSGSSWTDTSGNLWLFGGSSYASTGILGMMNDLWKYSPATNQWIWISGDNTINQPGSYGTRGIASATNKPGSRSGAATWRDASGNFWLFGGSGYAASGSSGMLNDLWKYTPSTNQWTWISGDNAINVQGVYGTKSVSSGTNSPGGRQLTAFAVDTAGNFWLFGGNAQTAGGNITLLNDLWKYTLTTNQWTWISGDNVANQYGNYNVKGTSSVNGKPGSRYSSAGYLDSTGNFWLFGGSGYSTGYIDNLNDLWKFTTSTSQWTWVSGDNIASQAGIYGTKGIQAAVNKPGGRSYLSFTGDPSGKLFIFGGQGVSAFGGGYLNDLWSYSTSTNQWTYLSGDSITNHIGVYGVLGASSPVNKPGARVNTVSCTDAPGNFWLFGGSGLSSSDYGIMNDLWKYSTVTNQWSWISGSKTSGQSGIYGTQGIASNANKPGARGSGTGSIDQNGDLWVFGGNGVAATSSGGNLNDLWKFSPSTSQWTWVSGSNTINQTAVYGTKESEATTNRPGARYFAESWINETGNLYIFGGYGYGLSGAGYLNDLWKYSPLTSQWTWMNGDNNIDQAGNYGSLKTAAVSNKPSSRYDATSWKDAAGDFWLFGGNGRATGNTIGKLNDLWRYSPVANQWTWISGDSVLNQYGIYGTQGIAANTNKPGARTGACSWTDASGNFFIFGGNGYSQIYQGTLNDLWKFSPSTGLWTWISGDNTINQSNQFSGQGIVSAANKPGARGSAAAWKDLSGNFWILGGNGFSSNAPGSLNDLLKYIPVSALPVVFSNFTARKYDQSVQLNWITAQEQNSLSYIIERSGNGIFYSNIGKVAASGNTSSASRYAFTDITPLQGNNFYRLKETDMDNKFMYSGVQKVFMGDETAGFMLLSNPLQHDLQLSVQLPSPQKLELLVRDEAGHLLVRKSVSAGKGVTLLRLPAGRLASGTYFITIQSESLHNTKTFIKQ